MRKSPWLHDYVWDVGYGERTMYTAHSSSSRRSAYQTEQKKFVRWRNKRLRARPILTDPPKFPPILIHGLISVRMRNSCWFGDIASLFSGMQASILVLAGRVT